MRDLRVSVYDETMHAKDRMKLLGITYQIATPQMMGDQWWFWNCDNVPDDLPDNFSELGLDPMEMVGSGLSQEDADSIIALRGR